jgi:hypothetical protein
MKLSCTMACCPTGEPCIMLHKYRECPVTCVTHELSKGEGDICFVGSAVKHFIFQI